MITWEEIVEKSDILGEYQEAGGSNEGGITRTTFSAFPTASGTEVAFYETITRNFYDLKESYWFNSEILSGHTKYDDENFSFACEGTIGDTVSFIQAFAHTINYSNGTQSVSFGGEKYTGIVDGDFDSAGYETCSDIIVDTDWSRSTHELFSYELTTETILGKNTTTTNTNYRVTTANSITTLTTWSQGTATTTVFSDSWVNVPTWKTISFETILTLGQTTRRRYSRFGNIAPATSEVTFGNASTYVNVEETYDILSFVNLTGYTKTSSTIIENEITQWDLANSNPSTEKISSTTGTSGATTFGGVNSPFVPSVVSVGGNSHAGSIETRYTTNAPRTFTREFTPFNQGFFETLETTGWVTQITTINFYPAKVAKTFLTTQEWTDLIEFGGYLSSSSFSNPNHPIGTASGLFTERLPQFLEITRKGLDYIRGFPIEFLSTHYSVEYACKLNSSDNGGGSYSLPIRAPRFAEHTHQAVLPLTGSRSSSNSTYSFYGSRFTATIGNNIETGVLSTFGQSTSFYRISSANPQTFAESHYILGGKQKGEATLADGFYTKYYEHGSEEVEFLSHPKNISWNNGAEITAYKFLEDWHGGGNIGFPRLNQQRESSTEAWPIPLSFINIVDD